MQTFPLKVFFSVCSIGWIVSIPRVFADAAHHSEPFAIPFLFVVVGCAVTILNLRLLIPLRKVLLEGSDLIVFAKGQRYRIRATRIDSIQDKNKTISIVLKEDFGFGTSFSFMPQLKFYWPTQDHPIVKKLRLLRDGLDPSGS